MKYVKKIVKSLLDYDDTYCPILFTIRFSIFFKEFAVNPFFTNATFKAFFMVHFTKGCAAFHTNGLLTYSTFSNAFFNCFNLSVSEFGLYFRIVQVQFAHIRFVTHGSVICGFGSRIGGNGSIDGRNCATGRFAFSGHFDTGMTGTGSSSSSRWRRSWSSASWRW